MLSHRLALFFGETEKFNAANARKREYAAGENMRRLSNIAQTAGETCAQLYTPVSLHPRRYRSAVSKIEFRPQPVWNFNLESLLDLIASPED